MKKLISVLLAVIMMFTCAVSASANMTKEHFVDFMSHMSFVDGTEYNGEEQVTRSQFVDFIAKVIGVYSGTSEANFDRLYSAGII
ncbi:MAG: hypothetical protein IJ365_06795, partial [Clostridia bacterium]|nr:hypothetical protein [Clostridia bacterium]